MVGAHLNSPGGQATMGNHIQPKVSTAVMGFRRACSTVSTIMHVNTDSELSLLRVMIMGIMAYPKSTGFLIILFRSPSFERHFLHCFNHGYMSKECLCFYVDYFTETLDLTLEVLVSINIPSLFEIIVPLVKFV